MRSPFKFLDAYTLADQHVFFGRDKEVEALYQLVFKTDLLLVYGFSGTGKTSIIRCGLASQFDGPDWYPFFILRGSNINQSLRKTLHKAIRNGSRPEKLEEAVSEIFNFALRPIYLIFDQFEELFILGSQKEQQKFIEDIQALHESEFPCKIILVMREEYIGHLYLFQEAIPEIFDYRVRVEPMTPIQVKEVMQGTFQEFNVLLEPPEEDRLQQIVENNRSVKYGVQLPYLQVYLDTLYREDLIRTYGDQEFEEWPELEFTRKEIDELGKIEAVLEKFLLDKQQQLQASLHGMDPAFPSDGVQAILDAFVTDQATKRPISFVKGEEDSLMGLKIPQDADYQLPPISKEMLHKCLMGLINYRLVQTAGDQLQLAHDSLAALIDQNRSDELRARNMVKRRIQSFYLEYQSSKEFPSQRQLDSIEEYLPKLVLTDELKKFINLCQKEARNAEIEKERKRQAELQQAKQKVADMEEAERMKKRINDLLKIGAILAVLGLVIFFYLYNKSQNHLENYLMAEKDSAKKEYNEIKKRAYEMDAEGFDAIYLELLKYARDSILEKVNKEHKLMDDELEEVNRMIDSKAQ